MQSSLAQRERNKTERIQLISTCQFTHSSSHSRIYTSIHKTNNVQIISKRSDQYTQKKGPTCKVVNVALIADHKVKTKESEELEKYDVHTLELMNLLIMAVSLAPLTNYYCCFHKPLSNSNINENSWNSNKNIKLKKGRTGK